MKLVVRAIRDQYLRDVQQRKKAMLDFGGIRKNRRDMADPETYIRNLRRGTRLNKLGRLVQF